MPEKTEKKEEAETKEIHIKWNGQDRIVKIKKLIYGDNCKIKSQAAVMRVMQTAGTKPIEKKEFDIGKAQLLTVFYGIAEAPFPHETVADIEKLPGEVGEKLYDEISAFNSYNLESKK